MSFKKGDLVKVLESPGAPFDIGRIFTVSEILPYPLAVAVLERPYRFHQSWFEYAPATCQPSPPLVRENSHELISGTCVNCSARNPKTVCKGAPA